MQNVLTWNMARIKTITDRNCEKRLEVLWNNWRSLQKHKSRMNEEASEVKRQFVETLDKLWDIGSPDAIDEIKQNRLLPAKDKAEDIKFYEDQRGARQATMSGNDKIFFAKRALQRSRQQSLSEPQAKRAEMETAHMSSDTEMETERSSISSEYDPNAREKKSIAASLNLPRRILRVPTCCY